MLEKLERSLPWRIFLSIQRNILWIFSILTVVVVTFSVLLRYILKIDLYGLEEIIILLTIWIYFIGGAYGTYTGSHITGEILTVMVKNPKILRNMRIFIAFVSLGVSIFFARWSLQYWKLLMRLGGETPALHIPFWVIRGALVLCFLLMVLFNLYHLAKVISNRPEPVDPESDPDDVYLHHKEGGL